VKERDWVEIIEELEFGLLDPAEARQVREQIAANPKLSELYRQIQSKHQTLRQAARHVAPALPLPTPIERSTTPTSAPHTPPRRMIGSWMVAASMLVAMVVGEQAWYRLQIANLADTDVSITLVTPATQIDDAWPIAVNVRDRQLSRPREISLPYQINAITDQSSVAHHGNLRTDSAGHAARIMPSPSTGGIIAVKATPLSSFTTPPPIRPDERPLLARLVSDRSLYRPGDQVLLRAVTLQRRNLAVPPAQNVHLEVVAPDGSLPWSSDVATQQGVASQSWSIPARAVEGRYIVGIKTGQQGQAVDQQPIRVERFTPPRLRMKLDLPRQSYRPGENVSASIRILAADGTPMAGAITIARLRQDSKTLAESTTTLDPAGTGSISIPLPSPLLPNPVHLEVTTDFEGAPEAVHQPVSILSAEVDLAFFPESGPLIAGIEQRVFFQAKDVNDEPVAVRGRLIDDQGRPVASFAANDQGRGHLTMKPDTSKRYSIEVSEPAGLLPIRPFPEVSTETVTIQPTQPLFAADKPIEIDLPSTTNQSDRLLVATCRGGVVGLATANDGDRVIIPLVPAASGVIRVTLYDRIDDIRRPLAERLIFRRPAHHLQVTPSIITRAPSNSLKIRVTDEANRPVSGAIVGVSMVDNRWIDRESRPRMGQAAHFLIRSEIRSPEDFETSDISLDQTPQAEADLDLVLATHGWRTFAPTVGEPAAASESPQIFISRSADEPDQQSRRRSTIETQHRHHLRSLTLVGIATGISFIVGSILRRYGWSIPMRWIVIVTIIVLVGLTLPFFAPPSDTPAPAVSSSTATKTKTPEPAIPSIDQKSLADRDEQATRPFPPLTAKEESQIPLAKDAQPLKEQSPSAGIANQPVEEKAAINRSMQRIDASAPAAKRFALPPPSAEQNDQPAPASAPASPSPDRSIRWIRRYASIAPINPPSPSEKATLIWEPRLITNESGEIETTFGSPFETGSYLLRLDAHTVDGRLGSFAKDQIITAR
jgi:hypothetical protein